MNPAALFAIGWLTVGALYGATLAKRYAHGIGQGAFIVGLSSVAWPFLVLNERD